MSVASGSRHRQDSTSLETRNTPGFYWVLESESPPPSEEDSESINSIQGYETAYARDTSDTESTDSRSENDFVVQVEYEVDSDEEDEDKVLECGDSSSGNENIMKAAVGFMALVDSDIGLWADTEDSKSGHSTDSELGRADYWECVQCKNKNNNPLFRYCEKCYRVRKNFFPPRPKAKKKKDFKSLASYSQTSCEGIESLSQLCGSINNDVEHEVLTQNLSQDSGLGAGLSQDILAIEGNRNSGKRKLEDDSIEPSSKRLKHENDLIINCTNIKSEPSTSSDSSSSIFRKTIGTQTDELIDTNFSSPKHSSDENVEKICITCLVEPTSAIFVHSGIGHIACCYKCAMKVWRQTKKCPVCNRKVSNVLKAFTP